MCIVVHGRTRLFEGSFEQCLAYVKEHGKGDILEWAGQFWIVL